MGADYTEIDLQMTQDGHLIAMHDSTVDRTTNGTGDVSNMTLSQIKQLDAGNGQKVPTLDEIISRYKMTTNYYIETKTPYNSSMDEELIRVLKKHNLIGDFSRQGKVIIQSFSEESLKNIHSQYPDIRKVLLGSLTNADFNEISKYAYGVGPSYSSLTKQMVDDAHSHGLKVHPYTVNTESAMRDMIALDVDGMFTNYPDRLRNIIEE